MIRNLHTLILTVCLIAAGFCGCTHDSLEGREPVGGETAYLVIQGAPLTRSVFPPDADLDNHIATLRIMAFDPGTGQIKSNKRYNASNGQVIRHEIEAGTYDFVFIANEPLDAGIFNALEGLTFRSGLSSMSFSAAAINSTGSIPMSQEINNVDVLSNSNGANVNGDSDYTPGNTHNPLQLRLRRLATRVDVVLESEVDLDAFFKGITFSNVAASVPVIGMENGSATRSITRTFTLQNDSEYFTKITTFTQDQQDRNITWAYRITRCILPYNNFSPVDEEDKAILFTVNMENRFSPYCNLEKQADNFTLERDDALLLTGVVKMPLELNIKVSPWGEEEANWNVQDRRLEVSDIDVSITDFNGARITFSSNLPKVHVLPELTGENIYGTAADKAVPTETEKVFNDLVLKSGDTPVVDGTKTTYSTSRFSYTYDSATKSGYGYMDILLDEYNIDNSNAASFTSNYGTNGRQTNFKLILSGEDIYGGKLQREINVNTRQYGIRFLGNQWGVYGAYVGAFYRNNERGERIISTQMPRNALGDLGWWDAEVLSGNVVLSTTPSFDPSVGTDNPGDPERYPVVPNDFKEYNLKFWRGANGGGSVDYQGPETGTFVAGRGRVYFRIGWNDSGDNTGNPEYATVRLSYTQAGYNPGASYPNMPGYILYIRRGEEPDYIMRPEDAIGSGVLQNESRSHARKFSPFNLTASTLTNSNFYPQIPALDANGGKGVFVDYPSQGGAFFQWGLPMGNVYGQPSGYSVASYFRRAYHPTIPYNPWNPSPPYPADYWTASYPSGYIPVWAPTPTSDPSDPNYGKYEGDYGEEHEVCPEGYHRPSDGYTDRISYNGKFPNFLIEDGSGDYVDPTTITASTSLADITRTNTQTDYSSQISRSEWRQSLWKNPWEGESGGGSVNNSTNSSAIKVTREGYAPAYTKGGRTVSGTGPPSDENLFLNYGFYADGFFDRRPVKVIKTHKGTARYGVALDTPQAAYIGSLVYNLDTNASVFFPAAGRRNNSGEDDSSLPGGALETVGNAGYYWSSSAAPTTAKSSGMHNRTAWGIHLNYSDPGHIYTTTTYGYSIRCVKD